MLNRFHPHATRGDFFARYLRMHILTITPMNSLPALNLPTFESILRLPPGKYIVAGRCIGPCGGPMWILRQGNETFLLDQAFYDWMHEQ